MLACLLALLAALAAGSPSKRTQKVLARFAPRGLVIKEPAWWVLFDQPPEGCRVYAGCTLEDGTYFGGWINSYSPDSAETADRELTLAGPIIFRPAEANDPEPYPVSAVNISARRLNYLTVTYVPKEVGPTSQATVSSEEALEADGTTSS